MEQETVKLTKLSKCAGCGAKVGAGVLAQLLQDIKVHSDPNLLVGFDHSDDASVYKISDDLALVQTVDFFPPIADDPYLFGQIAATNALSDVYAMGGEPKLCLNIMAVPEKMPMEAVHDILRGGYDKVYDTGTTTGTARVGGYAPDYDPWFTNEPGGMPMNRGTNAYWYSVMRIESYPQRLFALGEKFNTKGLKVILTETRRFNGRDHDISDCLQIWTDYDPDTPGEYLVYIRSDYENGEVSSDDYLFYTVIVDGDLTTGPDGGDGTTWSESLTTPDTTEQETTATDDTTESLQTEETVEAETASETDTTEPGIAALRGDVDCSGNVAIADAVLLARYIAEDPVTVTAQGLVNAELDGEAGLTSGDLAVLLQGIAGIETL